MYKYVYIYIHIYIHIIYIYIHIIYIYICVCLICVHACFQMFSYVFICFICVHMFCIDICCSLWKQEKNEKEAKANCPKKWPAPSGGSCPPTPRIGEAGARGEMTA